MSATFNSYLKTTVSIMDVVQQQLESEYKYRHSANDEYLRMTKNNSSRQAPSQPVVVQEDTHQNEIPENIDSELYSTDRPTNSFHEFRIEPSDDLVEALRNNGHTVEFRDP